MIPNHTIHSHLLVAFSLSPLCLCARLHLVIIKMSMLSARFGHIGHYVRNLSVFYARILDLDFFFDFDFVWLFVLSSFGGHTMNIDCINI